MLTLGLIKEGKMPQDNRVALTPAQCKWIMQNYPQIKIIAESATNRCYTNDEYTRAGVSVVNDISAADILFGIKEVPIQQLVPNKKYMFFSHTKKKQPHNQKMLQAILQKKITLIDYESLMHEDGTRIIGFGFFAGVVGAHNGMMAYGKRTGAFDLVRVHEQKSFNELIHTYFGLKIPPVKIAVTGSGRVAHGILEIMNLMGIHEVEMEDYLSRTYSYPVYVHLKGKDLYMHKHTGKYDRALFHNHPEQFVCNFLPFCKHTHILMNGVYWDKHVPRLFEKHHIEDPLFIMKTIADITDDENGSVPVNLGDQSIADPVYGVDINTKQKTVPYLDTSIDVMAVGNLPNELPRDASRYFGEQLIKFVLEDLIFNTEEVVIKNATVTNGNGQLTEAFSYLQDYAYGK
jgi:saccharopine dehydrogenase (NAD+, L-lysine forming)